MNLKPTLLFLLISLLGGSSSTAQKPLRLTLLHTNDHHGQFWTNEKGEWGMAARATLVQQVRDEVATQGGQVLLLSAGDVNTGTPESDMARAKPDFLGMDYMGYDAMAIGNHEFDKESDLVFQQQSWVKFPFLSANIFKKNTQDLAFKPYLMKEIEGLKVAILGLTTDETPQVCMNFPFETLEIKSPIKVAAEWVPKLKAESDFLIVLSHMGHYADGKHGANAPGDVTLARTVPGIDLIVGGHSQNPLYEVDVQNGTGIVQAEDLGKYVGRLDLEIFPNHLFRVVNYRLIPVNFFSRPQHAKESPIDPDMKLKELLEPFKKDSEKLTEVPLGQSLGHWEGSRNVVRSQETNLGNFLASVMKNSTDSQAALFASGLVRGSLPAGALNFGHLWQVLPFELEYVTVKLSGAEFFAYVEALCAMNPGSSTFPQMAGLELVYNVNEKKLLDLKVEVRPGVFEPVDLSSEYKLATYEFHAKGGGKFPVLTSHPSYQKTGRVDLHVLKDFVANHSPIDPSPFAPKGYYRRVDR